MLGTAELLGAANLKVVTSKPTSSTSDVRVPGSYQGMGIQVVVTGATTWLSDITALACVNIKTG
jgi:hypothetical protein